MSEMEYSALQDALASASMEGYPVTKQTEPAVRDMQPAHLRTATLAEYHILSGVSRGFGAKV